MEFAATLRNKPDRSSPIQSWVLFCVAIASLKLLLLGIDPNPKLYMGDSGSYIFTAVTGWIPDDRSYLYGFVIRWTAIASHSFTALLILQLLVSSLSAILFTAICRSIFGLPWRWAYLFGFVCALDPLQLLYERYVMAEAISLCFYAGSLYFGLRYLRHRRLSDLAAVQVLSVVLIAFRMSFLMLVQIDTLLLPVLAFAGILWNSVRGKQGDAAGRWVPLRTCGGHLLASVALMFVLHGGYKRLTGRLAEREPAYLHSTGLTLLSTLAPVLEPEDSPDPGLAELISHGDELELKTFSLRNSQRFSPDRLIDRLSKLQPEPMKADQIAKQTAVHALVRDPYGVAGLAWQTYAIYWDIRAMKQSAASDFSFHNPPGDELVSWLATKFHFALDRNDQSRSFLQRYYVYAWPYYFLILVSPLVAGVAVVLRSARNYALLLFIHISLMLSVTMLFGGDSVRYFQPISYALLLAIALLVRVFWFDERRTAKDRPLATGDVEHIAAVEPIRSVR